MSQPQLEEMYKSFAQYYYGIFDNSVSGEQRGFELKNLYHDQATMIFEGDKKCGKEEIAKKLESLPFKKIQHVVTTVDGQMLPIPGLCVHLVMINGQLRTDEDQPQNFVQTFILLQENTSCVVLTDIFSNQNMYFHSCLFNDEWRVDYRS